jgi:hypothetical protein
VQVENRVNKKIPIWKTKRGHLALEKSTFIDTLSIIVNLKSEPLLKKDTGSI